MPLVELSPEEAASRAKKDSKNVYFPVDTFSAQFGLLPDELLQELHSGRLVATGIEGLDGRYREAAVSLYAMVAWMAHADTPSALLKKVLDFISARSTQRTM